MTDIGFGPLGETVGGLRYHGASESHDFKVYPGFKDRTVANYSCQRWDRMCDTFEEPEVFCGSCNFVTDGPRGSKVYQCAGHRVGVSDPASASTGITPPRGAETVTVGHGLDETVDIPEPRSTAASLHGAELRARHPRTCAEAELTARCFSSHFAAQPSAPPWWQCRRW